MKGLYNTVAINGLGEIGLLVLKTGKRIRTLDFKIHFKFLLEICKRLCIVSGESVTSFAN